VLKLPWIIAAGSLALNAMGAAGTWRLWPELRPLAAEVVRESRPAPPGYERDLASIVGLVHAQRFATERERADFVRDWVHRNSVHQIDADHDRYAFDTRRVLSMVWSTYRDGAEPAHLSCGPRALLMRRILEELGIESRVTMVFTDDFSEVMSHTFLGVYDRDSKRWEIQDPDFNVYYESAATGLRASTLELVFGDLDDFVPRTPEKAGWSQTGLDRIRPWFEAMMLVNHSQGGKSVVLVNRERFDTRRRFAGNGGVDFVEFAMKHYARPVLVENQSLAPTSSFATR
jgi:hypothetical protein